MKLTFLLVAFFPMLLLADELPAPSLFDYIVQVWQAIQTFGGLPWALKISAVVTLIISSMKVSFLNQLIWSKLGGLKTWVAPVLGMVLGIVSLLAQGNVTLAGVLAYFSAGVGAVALHELLDTIKAIPGLGTIYVGIIDAIEQALGGPKAIKG